MKLLLRGIVVATGVFSLSLSFGADQGSRLSPSSLVEATSLAQVPKSVLIALGSQNVGRDGIADRNEPFNATDIVDERLPMRRFIIAGVSENSALVAYERGGRGHSFEASHFLLVGSVWTEIEHWRLDRKPASLDDLLQLIPR